jgi:Zn-dependent protease
MDDPIRVALVLISIFAGFLAFRFIAVVAAILRSPYQPVKVSPSTWQPGLAADEQAAVDELEQLGFVQIAARRIQTGPLSYDCLLFKHKESEAYALLGFYVVINSGFFSVKFWSITAAGRTLETVNRTAWAMIGPVPGVEIEDALAPSLAEHWQFHQARMGREALASPSVDEPERLIMGGSENVLPQWIESGAAVKGRDGAWHPTLRSAWRMTRTFWRARSKLAKPYQSSLTAGALRSAFFARAYEQIDAINAARPPRPNVSAGLLILTLAASLALWGNLFDWEYALILTGVILVHEAGHAIAMRAFGYRDISMFFIPFLGAAVTGTPKEIAAWKQAVMLLAGPVPGLLAALAFFVYRGFYPFETGAYDYGKIAVIAGLINLFNLLPFTPLDGGRLIEISVFSRWPRARLAFAFLSAVAASLFAAWAEDPYLLPLVAILWLFVIGQWRTTGLQRAWKEGLSPREQLVHLFEAAQKSLGPQPFVKQYRYIKAVFDQRKIHPPRPWESVAVVLIMLGVWGGTAAAAIGLWPHEQERIAAVAPDTRTKDQRAFDNAFYAYDYDEEVKGAAALREIETLGAKLEASDARQTDLALLKALALPPQDGVPQLERLIKEQRNGRFFNVTQIANAFVDALTRDSATKSLDEQIASLRGALERLSLLWSANVEATAGYRIRLAVMLAKAGNKESALGELQALGVALADAKAPPVLLAAVIRAEAWYYIDLQWPQLAVALLEKAIAKEMKDTPQLLASDYAWALVFGGYAAPAEQKMRIAAYAPQPPSTFLQNALGRKTAPMLQEPLDLAYAMIKANRTGDASELIAKEAPWVCRYAPLPWPGPWHEARDRAVHEAYEAVCPKEAKRAEAGG